MINALFVIGAAIATVLYGYKTRKQITPLALTFSFFIGYGVMDLFPRELLSFLPIPVMFDIMSVSMFFGFAVENGTFAVLTRKILFVFRGRGFFLLPALFLLSFAISLAGAGISTPAMVAPIAFAVCGQLKFPAFAVYGAVACGAIAGANFMFSGGGIVAMGFVTEFAGRDMAMKVGLESFLLSAVICSLLFLAILLMGKGWKSGVDKFEQPVSFNTVQKKTLILMAIIMLCVIIPQFAALFIENAVLEMLADKLEIGFIMMAGVMIAMFLNLANENNVFRHHVPWSIIVMLGAMSMLMGIGRKAGVAELLASLLSAHLPVFFIAPVLAFAAGSMSIFSSAISVVLPILFPMVPGLAAMTGVSENVLFMAVFVSATLTGISPLSTLGSMTLGGCDNDEDRDKLFYQVILFPVAILVLVVLTFFMISIVDMA